MPAAARGYGSAILSAAGAAEVVAVDIAESVVAVAEQTTPDGVRCEVANLASLPYDAGTFDVAVCFEVIEHVDDGPQVLQTSWPAFFHQAERCSSPLRCVAVMYPVIRIITTDTCQKSWKQSSQSRFPLVTLVQQHLMLASVLSTGDESEQFSSSTVLRMISPAGEDGTYVLAIAGHSPVDPGSPVVSLTRFTEIRQWLEHYERQDSLLQRPGIGIGGTRCKAERPRRAAWSGSPRTEEQTVAQLLEELHAVEADCRDQFGDGRSAPNES